MRRFQIKRITKSKSSIFLAGLIAGGILLGCAAQKQGIEVTPPVRTFIWGTVVSDTGEKISRAKVVAYWTERKVNKSEEVMSGLDGSFALELSAIPSKIEASKTGYFGATIEKLDAGAILGGLISDLKLVLKGGGIINVTINGLKKEELPFCDVKAIASAKEYRTGGKFQMFFPVRLDASTGLPKITEEGVTGQFVIEGVPVGPAEVRVRLIREDLPPQTVEVKGGAKVGVSFEFKSNKVMISGKATQLGNPLSDWLLTFLLTDRKPAAISAMARTASDGSYRDRLNPGTYEIELSKPSVLELDIDREKVAGYLPMFTTTYTVTRTETLNFEVSTLKKID